MIYLLRSAFNLYTLVVIEHGLQYHVRNDHLVIESPASLMPSRPLSRDRTGAKADCLTHAIASEGCGDQGKI